MFTKKVNPLHLDSKHQVKNISMALPSYSIKIWGKSVKGFLSYDRKNKQRLQLYIYTILGNPALPRVLIVTSAVYPTWPILTGNQIFTKKVNPLHLDS